MPVCDTGSVKTTKESDMKKATSEVSEVLERLIGERLGLCNRLSKLRQFYYTPIYAALSATERDLMQQQESAMQSYADVLGRRIAFLQGKR